MDSAGTVREGTRNRLDVMTKKSATYSATGGWGFESFVGGNRGARTPVERLKACYDCHARRADNDYVWGPLRP